MKQIYASTREQWRKWLAENHQKEQSGIWLVFYKKQTGKLSLDYEVAVEEALCFGWIDSIIKGIDENKYCRKFTPRKDESRWSATNRKRVEKITKEGRMTEFGLAKVDAAKKSANWESDPRPRINTEMPQDLALALARNRKAKDFFETLAPTYRKHFIGWIVTAKRPETRAKRLRESLVMLTSRQKLGLK